MSECFNGCSGCLSARICPFAGRTGRSTPNTTTVIMKTLGSEDEGVCGAHDVDNGFDEPRTASCVGMLTRVTAIQANAQVRATQSPISGALPAPSVDRKSTRLNSSHQIISYAVF